jgi:hypothetical protein
MTDRFKFILIGAVILAMSGPCVWSVSDTQARGGQGIGISCEPDTIAEGTETGLNFVPRDISDDRIDKDIDLLVSESFQNQNVPISDLEVSRFLARVDSVVSNEYGINQHDFGLVYNYFANASYEYGDANWGAAQHVVFFEAFAESLAKRNHVDFYLAMHDVDATGGQYTSRWVDPDEDLGPEWHYNSFHGTDGAYGKNDGNVNWYASGAHANLMFNHEYQHLCNHSNLGFGYIRPLWPNELFSTAAEYISGPDTANSVFWQPAYDIPCDQSVLGGYPYGTGNNYAMWRLFAVYLMQQLNIDAADYDDDALYQWLRTSTPGHSSYRCLYELGTVLTDTTKAWHSKLAPGNTTRMAKLCALFQDWAIAKAVDDTTRIAPGDSVTLGFGRDFDPYNDIGLFRDVDIYAKNTGVLPAEHVLGDTCLNKVTWVEQYYHPSDSPPPPQPDYIKLLSWASDYILFTPTSYYESGQQNPYDLKVIVRGDTNNQLPYQGAGQRLQVSIVTYG